MKRIYSLIIFSLILIIALCHQDAEAKLKEKGIVLTLRKACSKLCECCSCR
jgi:hypothetical protein